MAVVTPQTPRGMLHRSNSEVGLANAQPAGGCPKSIYKWVDGQTGDPSDDLPFFVTVCRLAEIVKIYTHHQRRRLLNQNDTQDDQDDHTMKFGPESEPVNGWVIPKRDQRPNPGNRKGDHGTRK